MSNIVNIQKYIKKTRPVNYPVLLDEIQIAQTKSLWELHQGNISEEQRKEKVMAFIMKQLQDRKVSYENYIMISNAIQFLHLFWMIVTILLKVLISIHGSNLRITAVISPIVNENIGVVCYI